MSKALGRTERLRLLEKKYLYGAYTDEEMAELVGVGSRSTIYKDRQLLIEAGVPFIEVERGRWKIDRQKYMSEMRVNVHEAAMLYLMARRAARQTRSPNPHLVSVLRTVALKLHQPLMDRLLVATDFVPAPPEERPAETAILEKIVLCWVEERKIRIRYRGLRSRQPTVHLVSPYLLEPSLLNDTIYLVGYSETMQKIAPFKVTRIAQAADTTQPIVPPESFDEHAFVRNVWSIWDGDGELVTVKLRFRGETAVRRVQESIWHPNQAEPALLPNGDLIWSTQVAEWREMVPWVRSWGANVEVLEPSEMRDKMTGEARRLAEVYGWQTARGSDDEAQSSIKQTFRDFFGDV